jgi:prolyl oligopeptidase
MVRLAVLCSLLTSLPTLAQDDMNEDPNLWLEQVDSDAALDWVRARNEVSLAAIASSPAFDALKQSLLALFDSEERIPTIAKRGSLYYNFWRDAAHPRGVWRRTTLESYRTATPAWEVVFDLDALATAEGENWVWDGAVCLPSAQERCLISLSRGGADASVVREFDLKSRSFVPGGFALPEAKSQVTWADLNTLFVATDFGEGTLTSSGYPRVVKLWRRGTPLTEATTLFEGELSDISVSAWRDHTKGFTRDFVYRGTTFYTNEVFLVRGGVPVKIDKPDGAEVTVHREWLLFTLREDWEVGGSTYPAGSLLATRLDDWMRGVRQVEALFTPSERVSLSSVTRTRKHLLVHQLDNVRGRVEVLTPGRRGWTRAPLPGVPEIGEVSASPVDAETSDAYFLSYSGDLVPSVLAIGEVGKGEPQILKRLPDMFETAGLKVEQHMATSKDGTAIPYFQVGPADLPMDGSTPTVLYGYGGFEVSLEPTYRASVGRAWLERGGVWVVANIRGGGEFGPRWHQAALKEHRHRAYEDFIAVGEDLITRGVTSTPHLGIMGGSNGGLLMGNMLTLRPDLWGAIVCRVPLLDMRRYHTLLAGASWMGEYGDPDDPEQWKFIQTFSPYHNVDAAVTYPPLLLTTSTRDDRVHPGHARKLAAKLLGWDKDVLYYENIEGGHGGAANNEQSALMTALAWQFFIDELGLAAAEPESGAPAP